MAVFLIPPNTNVINILIKPSSYVTSAFCIFTVRNEVAKVMFLHLSVSHSVHRGGGSASVHAGIPPPPRTRHTSPRRLLLRGRYASYWNAFLFVFGFFWFVFFWGFFVKCQKYVLWQHVGVSTLCVFKNWIAKIKEKMQTQTLRVNGP